MAFERKYTEAQKAALIRYVVDDGHTANEGVRAAAEGRLRDCKPFDIPLTTARHIARKERERRRMEAAPAGAGNDPRAMADDIARRLLARITFEVSKMEQRAQRKPIDTGHARELARAAEAALSLGQKASGTKTEAPKASPIAPELEWLEGLRKMEQASPGTASITNTQAESRDSGGATGRDAAQTRERAGGPVLANARSEAAAALLRGRV